jgi:microcin C transport system substrate-binding protein
VNSLKRLGIATRIRIVDGPQYKALTDEFNYDVITGVLAQSQSPGNEQREFWGSAAADQPGSRNVSGIKDPAIDALVDKVIFAPDRETLVAATHALDRVLLWNFFMVPQWHLPEIWVAYWDKFGFPEKQPEYAGIDIFSWWIDADKAKRLEAAR